MSLRTLKCCTPSPHLRIYIRVIWLRRFTIIVPHDLLYRKGEVTWRWFWDTDKESSFVLIHEKLLCICPGDSSIVPPKSEIKYRTSCDTSTKDLLMLLHLNVVTRYKTFFAIKFSSIPIKIILHIQNLEWNVLPSSKLVFSICRSGAQYLEYVIFSERKFIIRCGIKIVLGNRFHFDKGDVDIEIPIIISWLNPPKFKSDPNLWCFVQSPGKTAKCRLKHEEMSITLHSFSTALNELLDCWLLRSAKSITIVSWRW